MYCPQFCCCGLILSILVLRQQFLETPEVRKIVLKNPCVVCSSSQLRDSRLWQVHANTYQPAKLQTLSGPSHLQYVFPFLNLTCTFISCPYLRSGWMAKYEQKFKQYLFCVFVYMHKCMCVCVCVSLLCKSIS